MNKATQLTQNDECGFQVNDLVCALAIITLLGSVQLASFAGNRNGTTSDVCRNNLRRLTQAWLMYADDNRGALVPNNGSNPNHVLGTWVAGWLDFSTSFDNLNTDYLIASEKTGNYGLLGPYLQRDASVFRCPADTSSIVVSGLRHNRVRSYSMNNWMGGDAYCGQASQYVESRNISEVTRPAQRWVLAEESPASINDSLLWVRMHEEYIVDFPSSTHSAGTWLGFADGHLEFRRWVDPRTMPAYNAGELLPLNVPSPGNPDMAWLRERTTDKKPGAPL